MTSLSPDADLGVQSELNRKTFEALEMFDHQYRSGRLNADEYRGVLRGIEFSTRGLVPEPFILAIDQEISLLPPRARRLSVYASPQQVYILSMTVGQDYFVIRTVPAGGGRKVSGEGEDAVADAARRFTLFEKKLLANGYKAL